MGKHAGLLYIKCFSGNASDEKSGIRDVYYYNKCTDNSIENYFNIPSAVKSASIYGFNSNGWKFGNASPYSRIISTLQLSEWFNVEFTVTEIYKFGLIQYIYTNGDLPNAPVTYNNSNNNWRIGLTDYSHQLNNNDRVRIEWRNGTVAVYVNGSLIGTGSHSVGFPTAIEFHTSDTRSIRIKDLVIETL